MISLAVAEVRRLISSIRFSPFSICLVTRSHSTGGRSLAPLSQNAAAYRRVSSNGRPTSLAIFSNSLRPCLADARIKLLKCTLVQSPKASPIRRIFSSCSSGESTTNLAMLPDCGASPRSISWSNRRISSACNSLSRVLSKNCQSSILLSRRWRGNFCFLSPSSCRAWRAMFSEYEAMALRSRLPGSMNGMPAIAFNSATRMFLSE
mmetsp:Transcript_6172/g.8623  ORF Transcript_6172/g.8623 Transcript_6172/m.8623 type:complete len:206 (-) Transcript_6172:1395-2012(-)